MVATVGEQVSEGRVFSILSSTTAGTLISEGRVLTVFNFPTIAEQISSGLVTVVAEVNGTMDVSQARVLGIVRGRFENRRLRAWTFSLDGHDFYVIRLGETSTLVYDISTQTWMDWQNDDLGYWRANCGFNWIGLGATAYNYGGATQVVCGDDNLGLLWTLDPNSGIDESPRSDYPDDAFTRKVVGGVPMKMRETQKVGAAYVTANLASPQLSGAFITLRTSDDNGNSWTNHGTVTVEPGNYDQEFVWRSLGLIKAPGKIFEITDNGATVRIDGLDIR